MEDAGAAAEAVPRALVEHKLTEGAGKMESFNKVLLAYFYKNLFPFRQMHRWMAYGNGAPLPPPRTPAAHAPLPSRALAPLFPTRPPFLRADPASTAPLNKPDFFHRREFTFTLEGDVFVRYLCFKNAEELKAAVIARQPERIEIGPVYTATPDMNKVLRKDVFKAEERELIFDLDMNDYDDVRSCCTGASVCKKCVARRRRRRSFLALLHSPPRLSPASPPPPLTHSLQVLGLHQRGHQGAQRHAARGLWLPAPALCLFRAPWHARVGV